MKDLTTEFERLITAHSHANACWDLGCTTCGQMVTRGWFRNLDHLPDDLSDIDPRKVPFKRGEKPQDAFIEAASKCDIKKLCREAHYPNWLGLLGVILTEAEGSEMYGQLTKQWGNSITDLFIPAFSHTWRAKGETFDWQDLEQLEHPLGELINRRKPFF